jgi:iron-sulfur cluster repair protein YtfE (RIC family)
MDSLSHYMAEDHARCDDLFAEAENEVAGNDWPGAAAAFAAFNRGMLRHFALEEDILFPVFEDRTGMTSGPTMIMRDEHAQMRSVLDTMKLAIEKQDRDSYLGYAETLLMLMRQHNLKEEQILYPMIDQAVAGEDAMLLARMEQVAA